MEKQTITEKDKAKINRAIKKLNEMYEKALNSPYVKNKLAWSLYQVWKEYDNENKR